MMLLHLRLKETRIGFSSTFHAVLGADGDLLCGWILTDRLLVGGMSDNQYMMKTRILFENQEDFANNNDFLEWSWTEYRLAAHAFKFGKQQVRQPICKNKSRKFKGYETLKSATT